MQDVIFPYATLGTEPVLTLTNPVIDSTPAALLQREGNVDVYVAESAWRNARVNLRVQVPLDELQTIGASDVEVVATLNCGPTNLRAATRLEPSGGGGQWTGEVEIPRTLLNGRPELYATVAGTIDGEQKRWLGRTNTVYVNLEPPRSPEISTGGELPVVWRDFSETEEGQNPIDVALQREFAFVDLAGAVGPVIYLNTKVDQLRQLLDDRTGRSRIERAARDVIFDMIAQSALVAMFNAALAAAREIAEEGEPQLPTVEWQKGVLEALLPLMYPEMEVQTALNAADEAMDSSDDAQDLETRLMSAAARHVKATAHVVNSIRALESLDEEDS